LIGANLAIVKILVADLTLFEIMSAYLLLRTLSATLYSLRKDLSASRFYLSKNCLCIAK